jgi:uracil-DNA glycosylase family 4
MTPKRTIAISNGADCTHCSLNKFLHVPSKINVGAKYLVIAEYPIRQQYWPCISDSDVIPLQGDAKEVLTKVFTSLGKQWDDLSYIDTCACCTVPTNHTSVKMPDDAKAACLPRVLKDIKNAAPKVIITLGVAAGAVGLHTGQQNGVYILTSPHPAAIKSNPNMLLPITATFAKAFSLA